MRACRGENAVDPLAKKGRFGLVDYEKVFCPDPKAGDVFDLRGFDRDSGCMVVVRPDQYVGHLLPLHAYDALTDFFAGILVDAEQLHHARTVEHAS